MTRDQLAALSALVGRPYQLGASGPEAFDCYGLARQVQRLAQVDMPATERVGDYMAAIRDHEERRNWHQVATPQEFDLVLMANVLARDRHIGVYVRPVRVGLVAHAIEHMGVCLHSLQELRAIGMNEIRFFRRKGAP